MKYRHPLFKFLEENYATEMIRKGSFRIGTLYEYRDDEKYSGKILDQGEGKRKTKIAIERFEGTGDDLGEKIGLFSGPGSVRIYGSSVTIKESSPNCYIYCTTGAFFSDTLYEAIKDGKEACVMITDAEQFFQELSSHIPEKEFKGTHPCIYGERDYNLSFENDQEALHQLRSIPPALVKPPEHWPYREVRSIWESNEDTLQPFCKKVGELSKYLIRVKFDNINLDVISRQESGYKFGVKIILKNDTFSTFSIETPNEVFTPIIFGEQDENKSAMLGFIPETHGQTYVGAEISNCDTGITMSEIGPILCANPLSEIRELEYFTMQLPTSQSTRKR